MGNNAESAEIEIQGWTVERDGVSWVATRDEPLTEWQRRYGCRTRVEATLTQELRLLCLAEDVHAGMVTAAEGLLTAMADQGRQWREQVAAIAPASVTRLPRRTGPTDLPPSRDEWRIR